MAPYNPPSIPGCSTFGSLAKIRVPVNEHQRELAEGRLRRRYAMDKYEFLGCMEHHQYDIKKSESGTILSGNRFPLV